MRETLIPIIREALKRTYAAATLEPNYDHAEYERCWRIVNGLLIAFTGGDEEHAQALRLVWVDCQEFRPAADRDRIVYNMGTYARDDEEAIEMRLGIHWSQQEG